jgi:hypothetical protein
MSVVFFREGDVIFREGDVIFREGAGTRTCQEQTMLILVRSIHTYRAKTFAKYFI